MANRIENISGAAKGAFKKAGQVVRGRSGIYATLSKEHGQVAALLAKLVKLGNDEPQKRSELLSKITRELKTHTKVEDEVFYSALATHAKTADKIREARLEHDKVNGLLEQLNTMSKGGEPWLDTAKKLKATVEHHVDDEENEIFPRAEEVLSSEDAKRLDKSYRRRREAVV